MADKKISELNSASLPLAGTEVIPIVQGGETKKVAVSGLTPSLQDVTDIGAVTTNPIEAPTFITPEVNLTNGANYVALKSDVLTNDRELFAPDENGTIATQEWVNTNIKDNVYRANFYVMSSTEGSGLLFDGIVAINRFTEQGTRSFVTPTGTTRLLSLYFQNYLSATTAGACAGIKQINNADGSYRQGFDNYFIWGNNDANSNCQTTVGHYSLLVSTMPNVAISAFTGDFVGVGNDVGDTNLSFYCRRVSGGNPTATYTKVSCGVDFPANDTTSAYMLRMEAPQTEVDADRFVKLTITNLITGATATHTFEDADTPILDRAYATTVMRSNRNTGVATNIKFSKIQVIRKVF